MNTTVRVQKVKLPEGFDKTLHGDKLLSLIKKQHGEGNWVVESIDPDTKIATITDRPEHSEISKSADSDSFVVKLAKGTKPADGEKLAAKFEAQNPGYTLTQFEPHLGTAKLSRLSAGAKRVRGSVALVLGSKPWDIAIKDSPSGGYNLQLSDKYLPGKHLDKLTDIAETVAGAPGWYVKVNAQTLEAEIVPASPPTFPPVIAYPLKRLSSCTLDRAEFGHALAATGASASEPIAIDFTLQPFVLIGGTPRSGKSVALNAIIAGQLAAGTELVILDVPEKAVDFAWCKDMVRDHGWGCDSLPGAVVTMERVFKEGKRRAKVLADMGEQNWLHVPEADRFKPILVVIDEVSGLLVTNKIPAGASKENPRIIEMQQENELKIELMALIDKTIAQLGFVGVRMILATQVSNNNTGISPSMKAKVNHKILVGANPSKNARRQAFNDDTAVPEVPANIKADGKAARGVGTAELEGLEPAVFKSYFATVDDYRQALLALGVRRTSSPGPLEMEVNRYTAGEQAGYGRSTQPAEEWEIDPETGKRLTGRARANAARHELAKDHA